ncbi:MAG: hypothetical protein ACO1QB_12790 [Verrucomicrobiales bacterium]
MRGHPGVMTKVVDEDSKIRFVITPKNQPPRHFLWSFGASGRQANTSGASENEVA